MNLEQRISGLARMGNALAALLEEVEFSGRVTGNLLHDVLRRAYSKNPWFTPENSVRALKSISEFLGQSALETWLSGYKGFQKVNDEPLSIGLVMAGNLPAVGFHDLLCVLVSGHRAVCKMSSGDDVLIPFIREILLKVEPGFTRQISFVDKLAAVDAVIATGSNNTARYFEYYFQKLPHIIRRNRNGIAVLDGSENEAELQGLGHDIFAYFGMGCRSISKLYVPESYDFSDFFPVMEEFSTVMQHNKYMNNYDYHRALFLLNEDPFLTNNFLIVRQSAVIRTPVSVLHYEYYSDRADLEQQLKLESEKIQCVTGRGYLPLGTAQLPGLADYADGVDTMHFLAGLPQAGS